MHIEFRHLRTIKAIHQEGGLARAAERLHITQSALSHQIKGLEEQAGMELFVRRSKPMKLSSAGMRLLRLADQVLPQLAAMEEEFRALRSGKSGRLHIAIECHACFDWLLPVLEKFRVAWPDVDVDIRPGLQFEALPALMREEVDLVISSDPEPLPGVDFTPLFDYEPVFVAAAEHPLALQLGGVVGQQPASVAMQQRGGGDHLGVQARATADQAQQIAGVAIGAVHHRRHAVAPRIRR